MNIPTLTIDQIGRGLRERTFSATEVAVEALRFAESENPKTNALLTISPDRALEAAKRVDQQIANGEQIGPLAGVPIAVKDVIVTKGLRTTCASKLLEDYIPPYDATAVIRLEAGRRRHHRKGQLRRVCDGFVEREFGVRSGAQSGRSGARTGRFERRLGRRGRARDRRGLARIGYGRLDSPAGLVLRSCGCHPDIRPRVAIWT